MSRAPLPLCALPLLLAACNALPLAAPNPVPEEETDVYAPIPRPRKVDILFMVDNSLSMKEEQENLARNFPAFIDELKNIKGGLPDVHIGVVTSDLGAGTLAESGCHPEGERAVFRGGDKACGLDPGSRFIAASEGEKVRNYQGDLARVFACMAQVGTNGCGYEHQLAATARALSPQLTPENAGFLRDDAFLQIVLITDEDDCSAPSDSNLFGMSLPGEEASFRCARAGHVCQGQMPPAGPFSAPLASCKPVENGALTNVSRFIEEVKALKGHPGQILAAGIFGWPTDGPGTYQVGKVKNERGEESGWDYLPACATKDAGSATAALRVKQFVDAFGANSYFQSICTTDFRPALAEMGKRLAGVVDPGVCLPKPLLDESKDPALQPDCVVSETIPGHPATYLPRCGPESSKACWTIEKSDLCPTTHQHVVIKDNGRVPPAEADVAIKCRTCVRADDPRCPG
jgi:hypothetical protein